MAYVIRKQPTPEEKAKQEKEEKENAANQRRRLIAGIKAGRAAAQRASEGEPDTREG